MDKQDYDKAKKQHAVLLSTVAILSVIYFSALSLALFIVSHGG